MRALSIRQPWADAILHWGKDIENRRWPTKVRGTVYVHAGLSRLDMDWDTIGDISRMLGPERGSQFRSIMSSPLHVVTFGAFLGTVDIVGCVTESDSEWFEGRFGFVLANPVVFDKPIPYKGKLGFFEVVL